MDRLGTVCAIAKQRIGRAPVLAQGTLYPDVIEGEVLDALVQSKRNKHAALKLMRKLLKKYAFVPERLVTDDLRSYSAAVRDLGIERPSGQYEPVWLRFAASAVGTSG